MCFKSIARLWEISVNNLEVKLVALSVTIVSGIPYLEIQVISALAHASAEVEVRGIASGNQVALSIMVKRWVYPLEGGRGPTMSIWV